MNTNNDIGGETQDLLARGVPLPIDQRLPLGDREQTFRRRGLTLVITGLGLMTLTFFTSAALVYIAAHATTAQRAFGGLALLSVLVTGAILAAVGFSEWQARPMRSMSRELHEDFRELRTQVMENRETAQAVIGLVAPLPGRLTAIEQVIHNVPDFGEGVELGVRASSRAASRLDAD